MSDKELTIDGRRWFDSHAGNTYHSVHILFGDVDHIIGYTYGYGRQFEETALNWLRQNGHLGEVRRSKSGIWHFREALEALGITKLVSVDDVDTKGELHQEPEDEEDDD